MMSDNFIPKIHVFETLDSTNAKARELAEKGSNEGTVIVAKTQTQGRGRNKRVWHSPSGGLYVSVLLYPKEAKRATDLSIVAGVALAQTVKTLLPKSNDVSVKWPNDCLIGWRKVGGILCENLGEELFHLCVVGIGLNINTPDEELLPFKSNPFSATSFRAEIGGDFDIEKVQSTLLNKLFSIYRHYQTEGFPAIQYLWEKNCGMVGKKIELRDSSLRNAGESNPGDVGSTVGTLLGIDDSGALVLSNAKGERRHYHSGEITCFWP